MNQIQNPKRYTITLDDDPVFYRIIAQITGIPSLPFKIGEKLVEKAKSYDPVCVFVDVHLESKKSGLDILPALRNSWPFIPIFVVTSYQNDDHLGAALALGANDFLKKPINPNELTARMRVRLSEMDDRRALDTLTVGDVSFT